MHATVLLLRLIHVVCGALWVGSTIFLALFIEPSVRALGPTGGQLMAQLGKLKFHIYMLAMAVLTILSGITLFGIDSAWFSSPWTRTPQSTALQIGGGIGILALILGAALTRPAVERLGVIMPKKDALPAGPERAALQAECDRLSHRMAATGRVVAVLLVLAAAFMATARYV